VLSQSICLKNKKLPRIKSLCCNNGIFFLVYHDLAKSQVNIYYYYIIINHIRYTSCVNLFTYYFYYITFFLYFATWFSWWHHCANVEKSCRALGRQARQLRFGGSSSSNNNMSMLPQLKRQMKLSTTTLVVQWQLRRCRHTGAAFKCPCTYNVQTYKLVSKYMWMCLSHSLTLWLCVYELVEFGEHWSCVTLQANWS